MSAALNRAAEINSMSAVGETTRDHSERMCRNKYSDSQSSRMLTDVAAAELLGVSPATMRSWRCRGTGPSYLKLGRGIRAAVRYDRHDLDRFIDQSRQTPSVREA